MGPIRRVYRTLARHFGPQHWWPGDTPFEVMVGAILTQNTAWTNVEKAIRNLKRERLLDARRLDAVDVRRLARVIRPSGYFNVKARRLKNFVRWFRSTYDGSLRALRRRPVPGLRAELLGVNGIGRETADSILLYALDRPTFVVDAYTIRVLSRHGWAAPDADYDEVKGILENALPRDRALYNEYHALFVSVGKDFCRPSPRCEICPLRRLLPEAEKKRRGIRG